MCHNSIVMKNKTTLYHLIIDRSGSMCDCVRQTVTSFNEQVQSIYRLQQEFPNQEFRISLTTFADEVTRVYRGLHAEGVPRLRKRDYMPSGMTALNDAIGQTIEEIDERFGKMLKREEASVVVVILTDGGENSSRRFSGAQIAELIKGKEATGLWSFNFLGVSFDATTVTNAFGLSPDKARSFDKEDMSSAMQRVSKSMHSYAHMKELSRMKDDFFSDYDE